MVLEADSSWVADMPAAYDEHLGPVLFAPYAAHLAARVAALRPSAVLELAAGTGRLTAELVAALPSARVEATDLNEAMVAFGRSRVPGATWSRADATALPFPDGGFDVVACQFGVMFFPDRVAALREASRVLAPGGSLLVSAWDRLRRCGPGSAGPPRRGRPTAGSARTSRTSAARRRGRHGRHARPGGAG